jgi:hypothetical protein
MMDMDEETDGVTFAADAADAADDAGPWAAGDATSPVGLPAVPLGARVAHPATPVKTAITASSIASTRVMISSLPQ